jgi:hypothetical protein
MSFDSNDSNSSVSMSDESMSSDIDSDFSLEDNNKLCKSLVTNIEDYRREHGENSLTINHKLLETIEIILSFRIDNVSKNVSQAWGIDLTKDLCISFETSCASFILGKNFYFSICV